MLGVLAVLFWEDWRLGVALGVFVFATLFALNKMRSMLPACTTVIRT